MRFLSKLLSRSGTQVEKTTAGRPYRISNPTLGFLNLQGASAAMVMQADRRVLEPLFGQVRESTSEVPRCEVLFIYCTIQAGGAAVGSLQPIRELIKKAGAYVAVVAAENPPDVFRNGIGPKTNWSANVVLTIDRKGNKFAPFFAKLFESMFSGQSMLLAWVKLAPQISGRQHSDAPTTVMLAEAGHLVFERGVAH
jgi:hypothetical protein